MSATAVLPWSPVQLRMSAAKELLGFRSRLSAEAREDLAQEAMVRLLAARGVVNPVGYVRRVARNLAIDQLRRSREIPVDTLPERAVAPLSGAALDGPRLVALVARAPAAHRRVLEALLVGRTVDELVQAELAERSDGATDPAARARARDAVYKRRARALAWAQREWALPSAPRGRRDGRAPARGAGCVEGLGRGQDAPVTEPARPEVLIEHDARSVGRVGERGDTQAVPARAGPRQPEREALLLFHAQPSTIPPPERAACAPRAVPREGESRRAPDRRAPRRHLRSPVPRHLHNPDPTRLHAPGSMDVPGSRAEHAPADRLGARARQAELETLLDAEEEGVFGAQAGSGLQPLPSSVYWAGLRRTS